MANLTAATEARLQKSLAQQYRFDGVIMTLKQKLDTDAVSFDTKEVAKYEYNRHKFNRMNHAEQAEYEKKLAERKLSYRAIYADGSFIEIPKMVYEYYTSMSDVDRLTAKLIAAGADRAKVIAIVDGYGDAVDWSYHSLDSIIAEVWQSDLNSGDEPDGWIINEICRNFNIEEVKE